jgi:hypothetical protein
LHQFQGVTRTLHGVSAIFLTIESYFRLAVF